MKPHSGVKFNLNSGSGERYRGLKKKIKFLFDACLVGVAHRSMRETVWIH